MNNFGESEMVYRKRIAKTKQKERQMIKFDEYCKVLFVPSFDRQLFRITLCKNANKTYSVQVDLNVLNHWVEVGDMDYTTNFKSSALECVKQYSQQILKDMDLIIEKLKPQVEAIQQMMETMETMDDCSKPN